MKTIKLLSLFLACTFVLFSCSSDENLSPEVQKTSLLKSFKVKRDLYGAYSVDFDIANNTKASKIKNIETNTNEFHLYETSEFSSAKRQSENLIIDGSRLRIGFLDTNTGNKPFVSIEDDNGLMNKTAAKSNEKLKEYTLSSNEDGTLTVDFSVINNVTVDFVYNEDIETYEIHLEEGKSSTTNFSKTISKNEDKTLKIDFVNHLTSNTSAKGFVSKAVSLVRRKPRILVSNAEY